MDINNDLQQINTFVKGMNTDVSDALMDSSQYRYAENVRLATNKDENTGELRTIEGTLLKYDVSNYGEIIAMTSIRNLLAIITRKGQENYILVKDTKDNSSWKLIFKSKEGDDLFGSHISLVTRWENPNVVKLYIADNTHGLSYVNLVTGDHSGVIEGFDNIEANTNTSLYRIKATLSSSGGNLPPVKVLYAYRLYKEGGTSTSISPLSNIIVLYNDNKGFDTTTENSNLAVDIEISLMSDTTLSQMLVYRLAYKQVGQAPEINLIYDGEFQNKITDTGNDIPYSISFEEFTAMLYYHANPTIIESKGDYMFAANIKYEQDETDYSLKGLDFRLYSSGDYNLDGTEREYNKQFETSQSYLLYNKENWLKGNSQTIGGTGEYMSWEINIKPIYVTDTNTKYATLDLFNRLQDRIYDQCCSLRQGEVYRYGVIWYNDKGQKSSAYWLCDIMAPDLSTISDSDDFRSYYINGNIIYQVPIIGVTFNIDQFPSGFSGAEIVRCTREQKDKINILQGIMGFPYKLKRRETQNENDHEFKNYNDICAPYLISVNHFKFDSAGSNNPNHMAEAESDNNTLVFACSEYTYLPDDIQNLNLGESLIIIKPVRTLIKSASVRASYDNRMFRSISEKSNWWEVILLDSKYIWYYNQRAAYRNTHVENLVYDINDIRSLLEVTHGVPNVSLHDIHYETPLRGESIPQYPSISAKKINNVAYTKSPMHDEFLTENGYPNYASSQVPLGIKSYINWSIPLIYGISDDTINNVYTNIPEDSDGYPISTNTNAINNNFPSISPSGSTGRYILMDLENNGSFDYIENDDHIIYAYIANILNQNPKPYGGVTTKDYSSYIQHGNYRKGVGSIEVFDGDCYPGVFEFNACHAWYSAKAMSANRYFNAIRQASVCYAPIESDIDLSATYGSLYSRIKGNNRSYYFLDIKSSFDEYDQSDIKTGDAYLYNTAYGVTYDIMPYYATKYSSISSNEFDCRVCHSNLKTNGELIDNWLIYNPLVNYIDVDSRFGLITNLRLFKDKLLFWQEHATGVLSVNERTVLNDIENNDIVVGTGGTLLRYDYISTTYGMKPYQYEAEVQSNYSQYWWDGYNKEILQYTGGIELTPLTKTKGITNYINQREESDHPMLAYDNKYNEILAQVVVNNNVGETLVYNEQIEAFSAVYTYTPLYRAIIGSNLYVSNKNHVYLQDRQDDENYSMLFGKPVFPKVRIVVNKNNIYTKTFDNITFGGRMYKGSVLPTILNWPMERIDGEYIKNVDHINSPMHHLIFTFETPLKLKSAIRGDKAASVDEYDYRLAIPRNGSHSSTIEYGNRMRGKTMQCEIASDYNSTDFSLQYITTKFRMSWS